MHFYYDKVNWYDEVKFNFRDYQNGTEYEHLDPRNISSIKNNHFQTRSTYVLIHGFIGNGLEEWIVTLKKSMYFIFLKNKLFFKILKSINACAKWFTKIFRR